MNARFLVASLLVIHLFTFSIVKAAAPNQDTLYTDPESRFKITCPYPWYTFSINGTTSDNIKIFVQFHSSTGPDAALVIGVKDTPLNREDMVSRYYSLTPPEKAKFRKGVENSITNTYPQANFERFAIQKNATGMSFIEYQYSILIAPTVDFTFITHEYTNGLQTYVLTGACETKFYPELASTFETMLSSFQLLPAQSRSGVVQ